MPLSENSILGKCALITAKPRRLSFFGPTNETFLSFCEGPSLNYVIEIWIFLTPHIQLSRDMKINA